MEGRRALTPPAFPHSVLLPERFGGFHRLAPSVPVAGLLQSHIHPRSLSDPGRLRVSLLRQACAIFPGISFAVIQLSYYHTTLVPCCQSGKMERADPRVRPSFYRGAVSGLRSAETRLKIQTVPQCRWRSAWAWSAPGRSAGPARGKAPPAGSFPRGMTE